MNEGQLLTEQSDDTEWEMTWRQHNDQYDPDADGIEDLYGSGLYPRLKTKDAHTDHCIQLVDEASADGFLRGRMIPETISAEMIKGWMQRCKELHGEDCGSSYLPAPPIPIHLRKDFWVIDVNKECLVIMPPEAKFVALSYVWGQANHLTTVKSNLSEFRTEGAFGRTKPPGTIQDATNLTQALGFQYLWVDALCIVQDGEHKQLLISAMNAVYGDAELTLIAASGEEANAGLQGWKSCPSERRLFTEEIRPDLRLGVLPAYEAKLMDSPHARRGWT